MTFFILRKIVSNFKGICLFKRYTIYERMSSRPDRRVVPLTLYSDRKEIKTYWENLTQMHLCVNCEKPFNLLKSMGNFQCTQHPGFLQENGIFSCCGQRESPLRFRNNRDVTGLFPALDDFGMINGHCVRNRQPLPIRRRGCQRCDCNTSNSSWTHSNRIHISELAPLIPFIRKEAEDSDGTRLVQRNGFDNGYIRRCEVQPLQIPDGDWRTLTYESVEGKEVTFPSKNEMTMPKFGRLIQFE
jgi:hypothetical protein